MMEARYIGNLGSAVSRILTIRSLSLYLTLSSKAFATLDIIDRDKESYRPQNRPFSKSMS